MPANYARPAFGGPLWKPSQKHAVVKEAQRKAKKLTRRQCVDKVWLRAKAKCERCGNPVKRKKVTYPTDPERGDVNEKLPRSRGGDPCDPGNCELICGACHYGGPSGGHAPTAKRMSKR